MLSPGFVQISKELGVDISELATTTSWMILTIALSLFLLNPLAKIYGKRPIYVFAITVLFISSVIGGSASSYHGLLTSRVLSGFGLAPFEIIVQCTIGDLYFVHERATRIAFWNLCLLLGISAGSLIAGYIIENIGWQWCFWICAIMFGILGILIVFFVPETAYNRETTIADEPWTDKADGDVECISRSKNATIEHCEFPLTKHEDANTTINNSAKSSPKPMPYCQSIRLFSGHYTKASHLKVFIRPFVLFFYPAIFATFLIYGVMITWVVVFTVVNSSIFNAPPYNFSTSQTGLVSISPLILSVIGEVICGPLNDAICLFITRKNKGIYEPEFRLVLMIVVVILGTVGYFGFGLSVHYQTHWLGPVITYGIANMALAFASTCLFGYALDSYPHLNEEAFAAINARNIFAFGVTYFVEGWLEQSGVLNVFIVLGSVFLASCIFTIPLWVFGKRWRNEIAKSQWLKNLMYD